MKLGVVSDTHLQDGSGLPARLIDGLNGVDMILHAGDIVLPAVLSRLEQIAPVEAVCGNMDGWALRDKLHEQQILQLNGRRIGLIHGSGGPSKLAARVRKKFGKDVDIIVFGHSHHPMNETIDGVLMFNPGSPTEKRSAPHRTFGIIEIAGNGSIDARIINLP